MAVNSNDLQVNGISNNKIYPSNQQKENLKEQLKLIKENLLNPAEVTFCDVSTDGLNKRNRLTTICSETSETDSIGSTSTVHPASTKKIPKIPDGGWGWMVVFSSFALSMIADGISFSFGLIYSELLNEFNEGPSKTAWVGSLFMAVPLLVGPIMSNLVDKYGCRKCTMLGGLLGCLGFLLSSLANSIEMLFFTFGIIASLGLGFCYVTAVVSIAFWFDKKRSLATSIGASGTGLGTFVFAPLTQYLIPIHGWDGTTLILAGVLLNFCVCGALMRDPEWLIEENKLESRSQSMTTFSNSSVCLDEIKKLLETGAPKEDVLDTLVTNYNTEANQQIKILDLGAQKKYQSEMTLPTYITDQEFDHDGIRSSSRRSLRPDKVKSPEDVSYDITLALIKTVTGEEDNIDNKNDPEVPKASVETLSPSEKISENDELLHSSISLSFDHQSLLESGDDLLPCRRSGMHGSRFSLDESLMTKQSAVEMLKDDKRNFRGNSLDIVYENEFYNPSEKGEFTSNGKCPDIFISVPNGAAKLRNKINNKKGPPAMPNGNLKRNTTLRYSNYFRNIRVHRNSIHYRGALLNTHRYRLKASSCPNIYRNSMTTIAKEEEDKWYDDFVDVFKSMFDFSLFMDYKFAVMSLSTLILFIWYIIPYFYITEHLLTLNYSEEDSAYLIAIIGIFNTIGMLLLGWIGDQPWLNVTRCYAACLILCGVSVFLIPLVAFNYGLLVFCSILFGLTFASSYSFTPIIVVRLVDLDDFTLAYGLILLVEGIGSLIGPPLAGAIYDWTNRWDDSFYAGGVFIALSGLLALVIGSLKVADDDDDDPNNNENEDNCKF